MPEQVGSLLAQNRARKMPCVVCDCDCEPELIDYAERGTDRFERLRCNYPGETATFRRVWIGGYA